MARSYIFPRFQSNISKMATTINTKFRTNSWWSWHWSFGPTFGIWSGQTSFCQTSMLARVLYWRHGSILAKNNKCRTKKQWISLIEKSDDLMGLRIGMERWQEMIETWEAYELAFHVTPWLWWHEQNCMYLYSENWKTSVDQIQAQEHHLTTNSILLVSSDLVSIQWTSRSKTDETAGQRYA